MPAAALHPTEDALRPLKILFAGGTFLELTELQVSLEDILIPAQKGHDYR